MVNNQLLNTINRLSKDPKQLLQQFGIPTECNNPQSIIQYLMNSGKVTQAQINQTNTLYRRIFNK